MFYVSHAECVPIRKRHDHGHRRCVSSVPMCNGWSSYPYTMTHPDTMPCAFHVLRSTAHSLRVDDHGSRAVDIMCKRHDRTHTLALSQSNTQTRCKDYCNAMTTAHTRNGWPSIQTACVCLQFRNGSHAACRPWECTTAKVFCSMFYVSHAECVPIRKRHDHGHRRCVSSVPMCKRWSVYR